MLSPVEASLLRRTAAQALAPGADLAPSAVLRTAEDDFRSKQRHSAATSDEYAQKQREREHLKRQATEQADLMESRARERSELSRLRSQRDISDRAVMIADREKTRVEEGYYDPHRLGNVEEDRKIQRSAARHEADSMARYLGEQNQMDEARRMARQRSTAGYEADSIARWVGEQNQRDEARRMDGERAARHQQERIQRRVIEIESNNEMDRMEAKATVDRRRWVEDKWRRDMRWVWTWAMAATSKGSAYLMALFFVIVFAAASVEVDTVAHIPVVIKYDGPNSESSGGLNTDVAATATATTIATAAAAGDTTPVHPGRTATYRWVSPQRAAGKLLPSFVTSTAASLYQQGSTRVEASIKLRGQGQFGRGDRGGARANQGEAFLINDVQGPGIAGSRALGVEEGESYLRSAMEAHLMGRPCATSHPCATGMSAHQTLLMNLVQRGKPPSPPLPSAPPPRPSAPDPFDTGSGIKFEPTTDIEIENEPATDQGIETEPA
eukprot:CAMPEP_0181376556 /NCGR_PEP_ID=MMETSP1106-20121128/17368_1 /TAXON_ID=81844 /ORGANISM="Mantoniella antarctica, Strain SL-175" /LENGTH=496 /DNA_ID=CAMNT_0023495115 /DNA_START=99 /DNA_END=1586 /DNA_ORIENTATION=-